MLDMLNAEQRAAVVSFDRPTLVLSGAGTGKTQLLSAKVLHAVNDRKISPLEVMCVTFTRKAANELRNRVYDALRPSIGANELWIGTFHALSSRVLRAYPAETGLGDAFSVIQPDEARRVMTNVIARATGSEPTERRVADLLRAIDQIKAHGGLIDQNDWPPSAPRLMMNDLALARAYREELRLMNAVDYGDLIVETTRLMHDHPSIAQYEANRFKLVLVDEYQDTDFAQQAWIHNFVGPGAQLTCAGDDDQSIYRFRGARVEAILNFDRQWPNANVISLSQNYRCPAGLLHSANRMIAHNTMRRPKLARAANGQRPGAVHAIAYNGPRDLANAIGAIIDARDFDAPYNSVAILGRTNADCENIAAQLAARDFPVHIFAPDATSSLQLQKLISWVRMLANPADDAAVMTLVDPICGRAVTDNLYAQARAHNLPILRILQKRLEDIRKSSEALAAFTEKAAYMLEVRNILSPDEVIERILDITQIGEEVARLPGAPKAKFWRLYSALAVRARNAESLARTLELAQSDLVDPEDLPDAVIISTMHAMKGLQAPIIISAGWDKGQFPRSSAKTTAADLEDERKVAYVTITRASKDAYLLFDEARGPSPFLAELGAVDAQGHPV